MKIINASLEDPVARVSNETIGGLCHLVMTEVSIVFWFLHALELSYGCSGWVLLTNWPCRKCTAPVSLPQFIERGFEDSLSCGELFLERR